MKKLALVSTVLMISGLALLNCGPFPTNDADVVSPDAADSGNPDTNVTPDGSDATPDNVQPTDADGGALVCSPTMTQPRAVCTTGQTCQCNPVDDLSLPDWCLSSSDNMAHCRATLTCAATGANHCSPHLPAGVDGSIPFSCAAVLFSNVYVRDTDPTSSDRVVGTHWEDENGLVHITWSDAAAVSYHEAICLDKHCYMYGGLAAYTGSTEFAFSTDCLTIDVQNFAPGGALTTHAVYTRTRARP